MRREFAARALASRSDGGQYVSGARLFHKSHPFASDIVSSRSVHCYICSNDISENVRSTRGTSVFHSMPTLRNNHWASADAHLFFTDVLADCVVRYGLPSYRAAYSMHITVWTIPVACSSVNVISQY